MSTNQISNLRFNYRFYLYLGLVGAIIVGIGEYMLHFNPIKIAGEIEMLYDVPLGRARIGHFFAIFGVPLYFAGYYGLLKLFKSSHELYAKCLFIAGILSFTVGGFWITSRYLGAVILQKSLNSQSFEYLYQQYDESYQVLVWGLRLLVLLLSIFYVLNILKNKIGIPKWLAIFNPIVLLVLIFTTAIWAQPISLHLVPIAMNATHVIFFILLLKYSKASRVSS